MASVKLTISVNGGTAVTGFEAGGFGGVPVGATDTIQFGATDTTGWRSQKWRIRDYPPGFTPGGTWTLDADDSYINTNLVPSLITLPGGFFGVFTPGVEVVFDDHTLAQDYSTAFEVVHFDGYHGVAAGEGTHFGGPRQGWAKNLDATIRALAAAIAGGGGGGGFTPPAGVGFLHCALPGVLDAANKLVFDSDVDPFAFINGSKIYPDFGASYSVHGLRFSSETYNDTTSTHGNTYHNYDWHGCGTVYFPDAYNGVITLTGLLAPADGKACLVSLVSPKNGYGIQLVNESGSSTNVNRIQTGAGSANVKWLAAYCPVLTDVVGGGGGLGRWAVMAYPIT